MDLDPVIYQHLQKNTQNQTDTKTMPVNKMSSWKFSQ